MDKEKYFVKYIVSTSDHEHSQGIKPKMCDVQTIREAINCSLNWGLEPYQLTVQKVEATDEITTVGSLEEVMADCEQNLYQLWLKDQRAIAKAKGE